MRTSDVDILTVSGRTVPNPDDWLSRWQRNFKTARPVDPIGSHHPRRDASTASLIAAIGQAQRPAIVVAHGLGVVALAHAAPFFDPVKLAGAFLVAPIDLHAPENGDAQIAMAHGFAPVSLALLPFRSTLIASSNDPYCSIERAETFAVACGSAFINAGDLGHIDSQSGHGPWPDGLLRFGLFLKSLG